MFGSTWIKVGDISIQTLPDIRRQPLPAAFRTAQFSQRAQPDAVSAKGAGCAQAVDWANLVGYAWFLHVFSSLPWIVVHTEQLRVVISVGYLKIQSHIIGHGDYPSGLLCLSFENWTELWKIGFVESLLTCYNMLTKITKCAVKTHRHQLCVQASHKMDHVRSNTAEKSARPKEVEAGLLGNACKAWWMVARSCDQFWYCNDGMIRRIFFFWLNWWKLGCIMTVCSCMFGIFLEKYKHTVYSVYILYRRALKVGPGGLHVGNPSEFVAVNSQGSCEDDLQLIWHALDLLPLFQHVPTGEPFCFFRSLYACQRWTIYQRHQLATKMFP